MTKEELSNFAFLIHSVVACPKVRTLKAAEANMNLDSSPIMRELFNKIDTLVRKCVKNRVSIEHEAIKLYSSENLLDQDLAGSLLWAIRTGNRTPYG